MTTNSSRDRADAGVILAQLTETSTTAERVAGLRALGLRVEDVATACDVGPETVRVWETGHPPSARHHRLLDRLRYVASILLTSEGSGERAHSWLTSCNASLGGETPIEVFAERNRDVMGAAADLAIERHNRGRPAPTPIRVTIVDEPSPDAERLTPRERELHRLLNEGMATKAIAKRLGVTQATARKQLDSLKTKLGVSTLREAQRMRIG